MKIYENKHNQVTKTHLWPTFLSSVSVRHKPYPSSLLFFSLLFSLSFFLLFLSFFPFFFLPPCRATLNCTRCSPGFYHPLRVQSEGWFGLNLPLRVRGEGRGGIGDGNIAILPHVSPHWGGWEGRVGPDNTRQHNDITAHNMG